MSLLQPSSDRDRYRRNSLGLCALALGVPIAFDWLGLPEWVLVGAIVFGLGLWILLTVETYRRLKDAGLWGGLALFLWLNLSIGPVLYQAAHDYDSVHIKFALSDLIFMFPVLLGWIMPSRPTRVAVERRPEPVVR